jgi:hypothetical protein
MGDALVKTVIELTDLPADPVERELQRLIEKAGLDSQNVTMDDLRNILAEYLQDVLLEAKQTYNGQV